MTRLQRFYSLMVVVGIPIVALGVLAIFAEPSPVSWLLTIWVGGNVIAYLVTLRTSLRASSGED